MKTIIHDPQRGWLLLTETWPDKPEPRIECGYPYKSVCAYGSGDCRCAMDELRYDHDITHCLSTAIEIAKEDWGKVSDLAWIKEHDTEDFQDHHPYSVDSEFEVKTQLNYMTEMVEMAWMDVPKDYPQSERAKDIDPTLFRQIARLVKAKENSAHSFTEGYDMNEYEKTKAFMDAKKPTESQDELWRELDMKYVKMSSWGDPVLDINEAKKHFKIERISTRPHNED